MAPPGIAPRRTRAPIRSDRAIGLPRGVRRRQVIVLKPRRPQEEPLAPTRLCLDQLDNGRFALGLVQPEVAGLRQADWAYLSRDELWALAAAIDELVPGRPEASHAR